MEKGLDGREAVARPEGALASLPAIPMELGAAMSLCGKERSSKAISSIVTSQLNDRSARSESDPLVHYSLFWNLWDRWPKARRARWSELRPELFEPFDLGQSVPLLWSPARFQPGLSRANRAVQTISCLVFDFDAGPEPDRILARLAGLLYVAHATRSNRSDRPHWRLVLPFVRPLPVSYWPQFWAWAYRTLTDCQADPSCCDPARMYYRALPLDTSVEPQAWFVSSGVGQALDPSLGLST